jgi:PH domain
MRKPRCRKTSGASFLSAGQFSRILLVADHRLDWTGPFCTLAGAAAGVKAEVEVHIRATAASKGAQVTVLRQGYLLKKNSGGLRREWKRRFFVLDSSGMLYYTPPRCICISCRLGLNHVTHEAVHSSAFTPTRCGSTCLLHLWTCVNPGCCVAGFQEKKDSRDTPQNTVALQTATVKPGAEEAADAELRFCFRVVSPARSYVLQAADDLEAVEWMECIQVTCCSRCTAGSRLCVSGMLPAVTCRQCTPQLPKLVSHRKEAGAEFAPPK